MYILRCGDGSLYTGIATDVPRRLAEHEKGLRGAKYLRGRGPFELVFQSEIGNRSLATRTEIIIKGLGREAKEKLIGSLADSRELLLDLGIAPD